MAEKDKEPAAEKNKDEEKKPSGPKQIAGLSLPLFGLVALNLLAMLGGFGYIFYAKLAYKAPVITEAESKAAIKMNSEKEEKAKLAADGVVRIISFPEMNINLRPKVGGRNHYATVTIALKCNNDICMNEVKHLKVKVEDTIQTLISSRSHTELTVSEASFRLKT